MNVMTSWTSFRPPCWLLALRDVLSTGKVKGPMTMTAQPNSRMKLTVSLAAQRVRRPRCLHRLPAAYANVRQTEFDVAE